jgi:hypothetical protein
MHAFARNFRSGPIDGIEDDDEDIDEIDTDVWGYRKEA